MKDYFETERLILRRLKDADLKDFYEYAKSPVVGPMAGWQPHQSIEVTKAVINAFKNSDTIWAIVLKETNKMIGTIDLRPIEYKIISKPTNFDMGYCLNENYWGKGLVLEAAKTLIDYAFLDLHAGRIELRCFEDNFQSRRVIEKLNFKFLYKKESDGYHPLSKYVRVYEFTKYDYKDLLEKTNESGKDD